jgi:hypothetical protein
MNFTPHVDEQIHERVLQIDIHGTDVREDYEACVPEIERAVSRHKELLVLIVMHDFTNGAGGALWSEIKWNAKHFNHVERLAVVGEKASQRWMTNFCRAFTGARVRYFTFEQLEDAHEWLSR